jgi:hypothetical protein
MAKKFRSSREGGGLHEIFRSAAETLNAMHYCAAVLLAVLVVVLVILVVLL